MNRWLQNYAFRIEIHAWIFLVTALLTLLISWITVAYQTIRLAGTNPAKVLKYE